MTVFRAIYIVIIVMLLMSISFLEGTERGYGIGYNTARAEDILTGRVEIEFKGHIPCK
jgi:hypothetical protein